MKLPKSNFNGHKQSFGTQLCFSVCLHIVYSCSCDILAKPKIFAIGPLLNKFADLWFRCIAPPKPDELKQIYASFQPASLTPLTPLLYRLGF